MSKNIELSDNYVENLSLMGDKLTREFIIENIFSKPKLPSKIKELISIILDGNKTVDS